MPIPRISGPTPLGELLPLHASSKQLHHPLFIAPLSGVPHLRKPRHRAALLALLSLVLLTIYVFLLHRQAGSGSLILRDSETSARSRQLSFAFESIHKSGRHRPKKAAEQIHLTNAQELAAVSSFLSSLLSQNHIPSFVDPSSPIDPQLVLDFDTRGPRAAKEVQAMVDDIWSRNPVFLYSKHYSSASRDVKAILNELRLQPSPTIIDVDTRDDAEVLIPMLQRLTSIPDFPILIVGGELIGTAQDVHRMNDDGTLQRMIEQSGTLIGGVKKTKHNH